MSKILDLLLRPDCPNVLSQLPEKQVEITTLSKRLGEPAVFTLRALPHGRIQTFQTLPEGEFPLHIVLNGCVDPNWKDPALLDAAAGIATPLDAIQSRLLAGEIADLAREIEKLSGFRQNTVKELKND